MLRARRFNVVKIISVLFKGTHRFSGINILLTYFTEIKNKFYIDREPQASKTIQRKNERGRNHGIELKTSHRAPAQHGLKEEHCAEG